MLQDAKKKSDTGGFNEDPLILNISKFVTDAVLLKHI